MAHNSCCTIQDPLAAQSTELDLDPSDPTMSSCCRRDLLEQRRVAQAKSALMRVDRVEARTRLEKAVLLGKSPRRYSFDSTDSEGEADPVLQRLREERLQELQVKGGQKAEQRSAGAGQLQDLEEAHALEGIRDQNGTIVLHLTENNDQICQDLDELLSTLAFRFKDTVYMRAILSRTSCLPPQLGLPHAPALLVFREGSLAAKSLVHRFASDGTLLEERVTKWLQQATGTRESVGSEESESEGDEDDWQEPCEVCGRRYFHQHINMRALHASVPGAEFDSD